MTKKNPKIDKILDNIDNWQEELRALRTIILEHDFEEVVKWGQPCYTLHAKNVLLIHQFKEYCAILFMKGALLNDDQGYLIQQTENVQGPRQLRFRSVDEISNLESVIHRYIEDAIAVEHKGLEVSKAVTKEQVYPEEFIKILTGNKKLEEAFEALTPGRKRAYNLYFSGAKQSATRTARVEKHIPRILQGKGMND